MAHILRINDVFVHSGIDGAGIEINFSMTRTIEMVFSLSFVQFFQ